MRNKFLLIVILLAVILAASCSSEAEQKQQISLEAVSDPIKQLSPDAIVLWRTFCIKCGHTYTVSDAGSIIGLTEEEAASLFPTWRITAFTREAAVFTRSIDGACPDHFMLIRSGEELLVIRSIEPELEPGIRLKVDPSLLVFEPGETASLEEGILFDSLLELDDYLSERTDKGSAG